MAVIIDMDKPKCCSECKEKFLDKGISIMCGVFYKDCPLKSADEMIKEIEQLERFELRGETTPLVNVNRVIDIIHKYTDKEKKEQEK